MQLADEIADGGKPQFENLEVRVPRQGLQTISRAEGEDLVASLEHPISQVDALELVAAADAHHDQPEPVAELQLAQSAAVQGRLRDHSRAYAADSAYRGRQLADPNLLDFELLHSQQLSEIGRPTVDEQHVAGAQHRVAPGDQALSRAPEDGQHLDAERVAEASLGQGQPVERRVVREPNREQMLFELVDLRQVS